MGNNSDVKTIALVGGTGLLGRELIAAIVEKYPSHRIIVLMRAEDENHKEQRLTEIMQWIFGAESTRWRDRVVALRADMHEANLGISPGDLPALRDVSEFYCLAASTSFNMNMEKARRVNVGSLRNLIALLNSEQGPKQLRFLHYVGTAYVANHESGTGFEVPVDLSRKNRNTYERSKAEAEALLMESGLPYRIYRPSIIVGSSRDGRAANFATLYLGMKAAHDGLLPFFPCGPEVKLDVVPSDFVGEAIAELSMLDTSDTTEQIFNICAGEDAISVGEIYDLYCEFSEKFYQNESVRQFPQMSFFDREFSDRVLSSDDRFGSKDLKQGLQKLKLMLPFLSNDVHKFDNQVTRRFFSRTAPRFPEYAHHIFRYALESNFGRPPKKSASDLAVEKVREIRARLAHTAGRAIREYVGRENLILRMLLKNAALYPDRPALIDSGNEINHAALLEAVLSAAERLVSAGIRPGAILILKLDNDIPSTVVMLASCVLDAVSVLAGCDQRVESQWLDRVATPDFIVDASGVQIQIRRGSRDAASRAAAPDWSGEIVVATSGTTGAPKLVRHGFDSIMYSAEKVSWASGLKKGDHLLLSMPLFHAFAGLVALPSALSAGACMEFSKAGGLREIARSKATHYVGISAHFETMLAERAAAPGLLEELDLSRWNIGVCGDDYLSPRVREAFEREFMRPLSQGYGLSEALVVSVIPGHDPRHANSVGRALPGVEVVVVDDTGAVLAPDDIGEICVRGKTNMRGYFSPAEDRRLPGGYVRTGDVGCVDARGFIFIKGRKQCAQGGYSEVLRRNGQLLSSVAITEQLSGANPAGRIQVFFGHDRAFVFSDKIESALQREAREIFKNFGLGYEIVEVDEWPRTPVGKISRHGLSKYIRAS